MHAAARGDYNDQLNNRRHSPITPMSRSSIQVNRNLIQYINHNTWFKFKTLNSCNKYIRWSYILATLLHQQQSEAAFLEYEKIMQPDILSKQNEAVEFINAFVPAVSSKIPSRNFFTRRFLKRIAEVNLL